ncbi:zinc finger protein 341-like isoform X2 [Mya arenaria]|uniref:zinc finger protein 341-like isoform X2 n=1 Tax=Mya arenaria TaxID=6604 RepID=UPI0022E765DD|nr:zinc finger protein 341-like isoform X2 [Mya arenaria]
MSHQFLDSITGLANIENQSAIQSILDTQPTTEPNATQVEEEDIFQCGKCKRQFSLLGHFIAHKQERCVIPPPVRPVVQNTTLLHNIGASAFSAIGVQNGVRTQPICQTGYQTSVSQGSLPQLTQNVVLADDQVISLSDFTHSGQAGIVQANTIQLTPAGGVVQPAGPFLTQLAPRPQNNVTLLPVSAISTTIPTQGSAFTSPVSLATTLHTLVQQPQQVTIATGLPETTKQIHGVKSTRGKKANSTVAGGLSVGKTDRSARDETKKTHVCQFCNKVFSKNFDLNQHIRSHTGEKPFQCVVCGRAFAQKSNVKKHMSTHKVWPSTPGTLPTQPPPLLVPVSEMEVTQTPVTLAGDQSLAKMPDATQEEASPDKDTANATIVPDEKGDDGKSQAGNRGNYKVKVVIDNSFMCQYCPEKFKTYLQLKSHMVLHKNVQVYRCTQKECNETFRDMEAFLEHVESHGDDLTYRCHQCNQVFNTLYELGVHQYSHSMYHSPGKTGPKHYQCNLCMNKYATPEALQHHMSSASHNHVCPHCNKRFFSERFLRKHLTTHGTEYNHFCNICKKEFKSEYYLKMHAFIHTGEKPWSCEQCGASFNRKDKLKRHALIHNKQPKYKCPFKTICGCTKEFYRPDKLKAHLLTHSRTKPWRCKECGREFSRRPQYNEHLRGHSGDYTYKCDKCGRGWFRVKLFREHVCNPDKTGKKTHVFVPRKVKRRPGRPRKAVNMSAMVMESRDQIINGTGEILQDMDLIKSGGLNVSRLKTYRRRKILKRAKRTYIQAAQKRKKTVTSQVNRNNLKDMDKQILEEDKVTSTTENVVSAVDIKATEQTFVTDASGNIICIQPVTESSQVQYKKSKRRFTECYVQAPPASIVPVSLVERYITVQLTTANNGEGGEFQAQLIPTGDLQQIQFTPVLQPGQFDLPTSTYQTPYVIEGQPLTLTVGQGGQLGEVDVSEQNVMDIPVDIVTVSSEQALVCDQEVTTSSDHVVDEEQVYEGSADEVYHVDSNTEQTNYVEEIGDYETGDTALQGSENLINSSVEILGPENM